MSINKYIEADWAEFQWITFRGISRKKYIETDIGGGMKKDFNFDWASVGRESRPHRWSLYSLLVVMDGKWPGLLINPNFGIFE